MQDEKIEPSVCGIAAALVRPLQVLTERQIRQIDRALADSGPFAEVWLVKQKGHLRFIKTVESADAARS